MSATRPGQIITFYSYKGGTGRTMALANIAWRLADHHGLHVVVVDWDLEAPGLHRFFGITSAGDESARGLLEFFVLWAGSNERPRIADLLVTPPSSPSSGRLEVLLAGRLDASYGARLDEIRDTISGPREGPMLDALRTQLQERADIVLIDSRTGLSEMSGMCTIAMPDGVVLLTPPNEQGFEGAESVARAIAHSRASEEARQTVTTWLAITRVPIVEESSLTEKWWSNHADRFQSGLDDGSWTAEEHPDGIRSHWFPHRSRWAFGESILHLELPAGSPDPLLERYAIFAARLASWWHRRRASAAPDALAELERKVQEAESRGDQVGLGASLFELGIAYRRAGRHEAAGEALERSLAIDYQIKNRHGIAVTHQTLGLVRLEQGLLEQAENHLTEALAASMGLEDSRLSASIHGTLGMLAMRRSDTDRAVAHYSGALSALAGQGEPRHEAVTLNALGHLHLGRASLDLAEDVFSRALTASRAAGDPIELANALTGLGTVLLGRRQPERALKKFDEALEWRARLQLGPSPGFSRTLRGRGAALLAMGDRTRAGEALALAAEVSRGIGDVEGEIAALKSLVDHSDTNRAVHETRLAMLESSNLQARVQNFVEHMHAFTQCLVRLDPDTGRPLLLAGTAEPDLLASGFLVERSGVLLLFTAKHVLNQGVWALETRVAFEPENKVFLHRLGPHSAAEEGDLAWVRLDLDQLRRDFIQDPNNKGKALQLPRYIGPLDQPPTLNVPHGFAASNNAVLAEQSRYLWRRGSYEIGMEYLGRRGKLHEFRLARRHQGDDYYRGASGAPIADPEGRIVSMVVGGDGERGTILGSPLAELVSNLNLPA